MDPQAPPVRTLARIPLQGALLVVIPPRGDAEDSAPMGRRADRQEMEMYLEERDEGDYRIYAGALEAGQADGFVAAVVVNRCRGVERPRKAYRDVNMSGGHRWRDAQAALRYAVARAREVIRTEPERLAC